MNGKRAKAIRKEALEECKKADALPALKSVYKNKKREYTRGPKP